MSRKSKEDRLFPFNLYEQLHEWTRQPEGQDNVDDESLDLESSYDRKYVATVWRPNEVFEKRLKITSSSRGRSSVRIIAEDEDGLEYSIFFSEFETLVRRGIEPGGYTEGKWTYAKRGQSYGVIVA